MRSTNVVAGNVLGIKALALLKMVSFDDQHERSEAYGLAIDRFSEKSVRIKLAELTRRGYLGDANPAQSWLTEKGRKALEAHHA